MQDQALYDEVARFFHERLNISASSLKGDLFETGILDSLTFVDLVLFLEQELDIRIAPDELEPDNFRSVGKIAAFAAAHGDLKRVGAA